MQVGNFYTSIVGTRAYYLHLESIAGPTYRFSGVYLDYAQTPSDQVSDCFPLSVTYRKDIYAHVTDLESSKILINAEEISDCTYYSKLKLSYLSILAELIP